MRRARVAALLVALAAGCRHPAPINAPPRPADRPRAVLLFIGDGMGAAQVTLGRLVAGGPDHRLALDQMPVTGFSRTHSANDWVTDSAAAATALATGHRTNNFAVGVDPNGRPLRTILDHARDRGWATGLVTTSKITHATPAAFAAHVPSRALEAQIAQQLLEARADVLLGGGARFFPEELLERFRQAGYLIVRTADELAAVPGPHVLGLFHEGHVDYVPDRTPEQPSLPQMTRRAIELLSRDPEGFFLMVEGARIDMACHASDAPTAALEMIEFDQAVRVALDWARGRPDVLIVVTADHATGGLAITEKAATRRDRFAAVRASAERMAHLAAEGRPERRLREVLRQWAGIQEITPEQEEEFYRRLPDDPARPLWDASEHIGALVSAHCGITFIPFAYRAVPPNTTHGHDGAMVPIYAWGCGAQHFGGTLGIDEIGRRLIRTVASPP